MTSRDSSRILVIGAGLTGTAAARSLAERGQEVTVIERDVPASAAGSSHGSARIFRYAYPDAFHVGLVARSRDLFTELESRAGTRLITPAGALDHGELRKPAQLARALETVGVEHELLSAAEAQGRWPGMRAETEVLFHPGAGVIDAEGTVLAQKALAEQAGARFLTGWEATAVRRSGAGYTVRSSTGEEIHARQVVIAAGAWIPALLAESDLPAAFLGRLPRAVVTQENAYHFPYRDPADAGEVPPGATTSWPTSIHKTAQMQVYTLPGGRDAGHRGQKVAEYAAGPRLADGAAQTGRIDPANRRRVIEHVQRHLPGLVPEPYAETTCLFTTLPEERFLLDAAEGLVLASPCSGHGAKFAPLIGELVADLAGGAPGLEEFRVPARTLTGAAR